MLYFEKVVFNFNIQVIIYLQFVLLLPNFKILPFFEVMKRLSNILNVLFFTFLFCMFELVGIDFFVWCEVEARFFSFCFSVWTSRCGNTQWERLTFLRSSSITFAVSGPTLLFIHSSIFVPVLHNLNHFLKYYKAKLLTEQFLFMLSFI